jgi:hypothetical protein
MSPPTTLNGVFAELVKRLAKDTMLLHCLEYSYIPEKRERVATALHNFLPDNWKTEVKDVWREFNTYCK